MANRNGHQWRFFRAGGVDQVVLESPDDLARLGELDQKLWVALACPTKGTEVDEKTLALIDSDHDGRVRVPEVLAAVEWAGRVLKNLALLYEKGESIPLSELDAATEEGRAVLASAQRILADLGTEDRQKITLADVAALEAVFVSTRFNGDGVVPADSAADEATRQAIAELIGAVGSVPDRSGKPGIDQKLLDSFFEQAASLLAWDSEGRAEGVKPLGDATEAAAECLAAVQAKLDDYFTRCRIAEYDVRAATALSSSEPELLSLARKSLSLADADLASLPVARIEAGRELPLTAGLNPAWVGRIEAFVKSAVVPLLGPLASLKEAELGTIVTKLDAYRAWQAKKPSGAVAALGAEAVRRLVDGGFKAKIEGLIREDAALTDEYAQIASVEKAIRFRRDLLLLLRNFVSFADFYGRQGAIFQAGTLYLDGRACELTVYVDDPAKHAVLAGLSKAYLAYCECTRGAGEKKHIVSAFTAGDVDRLLVGRNGVFYDRKGRDWDARITNIVANPISVRQAFWSPYKRLLRMVEEQVAKRASEKEKESATRIDNAATAAANADQTPVTPAGSPPTGGGAASAKKFDVGVVAALGVAVAGAATFLSSVLAMFFGLGVWMPLGIAGVLLAISGPSMLIAWLKLRQRNLGPILDANGWAVNGRVCVNVPFGGALTSVAKLPDGARRVAQDPFAERQPRWWLWLLISIVVGLGTSWALGRWDARLPRTMQSRTLLTQPR